MKAVLDEIHETILKIDKSKWTSVTFGQVAFQKKDSIDRNNTDVKFYVKGEHMESEDLHIRQWGELADEYLGPAFIRRFESGDILYGSRRTYLKKVAVAHFDGITSNTTFVINANEGLIINELLPFLMLSEGFTQHSIKNSKGSVNPYINWKDIANYEFLLPPKRQQARLAELVSAADHYNEEVISLFNKADTLRKIALEEYITKGIASNDSKWNSYLLGELIEVASGQVPAAAKEYQDFIQIGPEHIESNTGRILEKNTVSQLGISSGNYLFKDEHILYSKIRPYLKKVAKPNFSGLCSADIYPVKPKDNRLLKDFLFYYFLSEKFTSQILSFQNRTGIPKVNREELSSIEISIPPMHEQQQIVRKLEEIDKIIENISTHKIRVKQLQTSLINQFF